MYFYNSKSKRVGGVQPHLEPLLGPDGKVVIDPLPFEG